MAGKKLLGYGASDLSGSACAAAVVGLLPLVRLLARSAANQTAEFPATTNQPHNLGDDPNPGFDPRQPGALATKDLTDPQRSDLSIPSDTGPCR
jgi:hypothetical protein